MSRHVSVETLAKRQEGVLSARKAARIDAHISGCARCSGTSADLTSVSSLLAATRLPPMPDALAERIQMAIAEESAARLAGTAALGAQARAADASEAGGAHEDDAATPRADDRTMIPGRPDLPARSGRARRSSGFRLPSLSSPLVLRGLAATAAVVVIAGVGYVLANGQTQTSASHKAAAKPGPYSGGSRVPNANLPVAASGARPVSVHYRLNGRVVTTTAVATDANFRRDSLAPLLHRKLVQTRNISATPNPAPPSPAPSAGGSSPAPQTSMLGLSVNVDQIERCLSRVNEGRQVLLADVARFLGKPATIIVLKSLQSAAVLDVAIVGPACSASNPHLIFRTTIPAG